MNQKKIDEVLEKFGLKKTLLRRSILTVLATAKKPLTQAEIISALAHKGAKIDRVSVYRNLINLRDARVLHEVDANNYVFCFHECEDHAHLLLFCQTCNKHQEIKEHDRIDSFLKALGGFRFFGKEQPIFLRGVCESCTLADG